MLNVEGFNLQEEFNKRIKNLSDANHFRIKQLSNFIKFFNEDKKAIVDYFRESFVNLKGEIPKVMFECLTDVISSTFYKDSQSEDSYYVLFSKLLLNEFHWMVKKFRTKQQIEIVANLIKSWSEKKWGPCKEAIYLKDFTDYLNTLLTEHKINMDDECYVLHLDDTAFDQYLNSKANSFIMNGLRNSFIKQYFNLYLKDKVLNSQYYQNVDKQEFMNLILREDQDITRRKLGVINKFKPIFLILKEKLMEQIIRRELFIRQLLLNRNQLYMQYEHYLEESDK